ncbi:hypothetical protein GIB67_021602 [Kingdonia uniflora]|uniref:Uncharacterized protein n=1 Tax=Kingdonia uniflora TaxID=39325 RepID=A0A7J7MDQ3_9MAGN|nr:hypothetical protein GIB67_021602 [Kingdonia uniflora]
MTLFFYRRMSNKRFLIIWDVDNQSPLLDFTKNDLHLTPLYSYTEMPSNTKMSSEEQTPTTQNATTLLKSFIHLHILLKLN